MKDRDGGLGSGRQSVVVTKPKPAAQGKKISSHPQGTTKPPAAIQRDPRTGNKIARRVAPQGTGMKPPLRRMEKTSKEKGLAFIPPPARGGGGKPLYRGLAQNPDPYDNFFMDALQAVNTAARRSISTLSQEIVPPGIFAPRGGPPPRVPILEDPFGKGAYPPYFTTPPWYKDFVGFPGY